MPDVDEPAPSASRWRPRRPDGARTRCATPSCREEALVVRQLGGLGRDRPAAAWIHRIVLRSRSVPIAVSFSGTAVVALTLVTRGYRTSE